MELYFKIGIITTLYDWRFIAPLLAIELAVLFYVFKRSRNVNLVMLALIVVHFAYEVFYYLSLVPNMDWWIPPSDPAVRAVLDLQWILYFVLLAYTVAICILPGLKRSLFGEAVDSGLPSETRPSFGITAARLGPSELLPFACIVTFIVGQQVYGYLSDYWLFQEADSERYIEEGVMLYRDGLKRFTDHWMLAPGRVHQSHLDVPFPPILWAVIYTILSPFSKSPLLIDVTNHAVSFLFYTLSVFGTYLLGRELFDRKVGIYAALFLTVAPYYAYLGYFYMTDVPMTAMVVMCLYFFLRSIREESYRFAAYAGFFFVGAALTKLIGLSLVWLIVIALFVFGRLRHWRQFVIFCAAVAVLSMAIAAVLYSLYGDHFLKLLMEFFERIRILSGKLAFEVRREYLSVYHKGEISFFFYLRFIAAMLGFSVVSLAVASLYLRYKEKLSAGREHLFLIL